MIHKRYTNNQILKVEDLRYRIPTIFLISTYTVHDVQSTKR
uniref:Uncharacterized protein n=1 Tax=Arundo donax TaxID=35708 RepID=A0A0A9DP00_ARUDO